MGAWRLDEMSPTSGVTAMRLAPMNIPQKIASASSFVPKMNARVTGSGMSTRKSVSSGTSEWLMRTVMKAAIHIGRPNASVVSAASALR